ncbi:hypothetical protein [Sphingomicrobium maritimum]|uniref:hypothetical protein n=1 Tax=Sphingomicrobium maritimum TaxID=3133972 RepID=UPI003D769B43
MRRANRLVGGADDDTLTGGTGADVFVLEAGSRDDIMDFSTALETPIDTIVHEVQTTQVARWSHILHTAAIRDRQAAFVPRKPSYR